MGIVDVLWPCGAWRSIWITQRRLGCRHQTRHCCLHKHCALSSQRSAWGNWWMSVRKWLSRWDGDVAVGSIYFNILHKWVKWPTRQCKMLKTNPQWRPCKCQFVIWRVYLSCGVFWLHLQVKKLKAQLEQKTQKNGTESNSSPDGEILENGTDPNIIELQSAFPYEWKRTRSCISLLFSTNMCLFWIFSRRL